MQEDDFKRASLRGRGWKIMRGQDKAPPKAVDPETAPEETPSRLQLTPEEIDDVLDAAPPALGTMRPAPSDAPIFDDLFEQERTASQFFARSRPLTSEAFGGFDDAGDEDAALSFADDETFVERAALTSQDERIADDDYDIFDVLYEPDLIDTHDEPSDAIATQEASRASITGIFEAEEFIPEPLSEEEQAELESEISDTKSLADMLMTEELRAQDLDVYQSETLSASQLGAHDEDLGLLDTDRDAIDEIIAGPVDFLEDDELGELELEAAIPDDPGVEDPFGTTQFDPFETTQVDGVIEDDIFIALDDEVVVDEVDVFDEGIGESEVEVVDRLVATAEPSIMMEAIPGAEDSESVESVDLSHEVRRFEGGIEALVPNAPEVVIEAIEQPEAAFGAFDMFDEPADAVFASEGVGPSGGSRTREGMPLVEDLDKPRAVKLQEAKRRTSVVHDLTPLEPEVRSKRRAGVQMMDEKGSGGIYVDETVGASEDESTALESPFGRQKQRPRATDLFTATRPADGTLLDQLVDETRLRELWDLIEALQDEVVGQISGDRERTDVYQQELLVASGLLLESRENYDDARAIAYRIRADLNRDRKVAEDIRRYRPLVLNYVIGWGIALVLLALMNGLVKNVADNIDAPFFAAAYLPSVFGGAGGLFLAYSTLHKHTAVRRDFDSIHVPWYLFSPLVGGLMGFLVFLVSVAVVTTTVTQDITDPATLGSSPVVIWALAFIGGMQQNWVISWLQSLRGRISGNRPETAESR